jgi:hypothetical protein
VTLHSGSFLNVLNVEVHLRWVGPVRRRSAVRRVLRARCHHCLDDASSLLFDHSYCRSTQVDSRVSRLTAPQPLKEIFIILKSRKKFCLIGFFDENQWSEASKVDQKLIKIWVDLRL